MIDPRLPTCISFFLSGAVYVRGATLFKYTGCGACEGGHYRNLFPVFFDNFGTSLGAFSIIFGLGGAPATSGGTPWPPEGSQGHFGRSFCHSIVSFWGSFHCLVLGVFWQPLGRPFHRFFGVVFRRALFGCPGRRFDTQSARKGSPVIPPEVGLLW